MKDNPYQELFEYLSQELDAIALDSQLHDIKVICDNINPTE